MLNRVIYRYDYIFTNKAINSWKKIMYLAMEYSKD